MKSWRIFGIVFRYDDGSREYSMTDFTKAGAIKTAIECLKLCKSNEFLTIIERIDGKYKAICRVNSNGDIIPPKKNY